MSEHEEPLSKPEVQEDEDDGQDVTDGGQSDEDYVDSDEGEAEDGKSPVGKKSAGDVATPASASTAASGTDKESSTGTQQQHPPYPYPPYGYAVYYPPLPYRYWPPPPSDLLTGAQTSTKYTDMSTRADPPPDTKRNRGGVTDPFPEKLHRLLDYAEINDLLDVVSFCSHGRAFGVHLPRRFVAEVMPRFFRQSRLTSFHRQLHLYGFKRISQGPDNGCYYHELFLRGRPGLCVNMKRTRIKGDNKAKKDPENEPNFYAMPPIPPRPWPMPRDPSSPNARIGNYYTYASSPKGKDRQGYHGPYSAAQGNVPAPSLPPYPYPPPYYVLPYPHYYPYPPHQDQTTPQKEATSEINEDESPSKDTDTASPAKQQIDHDDPSTPPASSLVDNQDTKQHDEAISVQPSPPPLFETDDVGSKRTL